MAQQAKLLGKQEWWRPLLDLTRTWAIIMLVLGVFFAYPSTITFVVAFIVLATQQYALLILMHDGQHWMLHPNRQANNFISTWLIGAPCGTPFKRSQEQHLTHHRELGSASEDPAFVFYCFGMPSPKDTPVHLAKHFLWSLLAGRFVYSFLGEDSRGPTNGFDSFKRLLRAYMPIALVQVILLLIFLVAGQPWAYFVLWILPLVSFVSFFDAFRQFAEHAHPGPDGTARTLLISTLSNPLERLFFAPFGMNYHAEHHLFPYVPYYRLHELSEQIRGSEQVAEIEWRSSYLSSLKHYLGEIGLRKHGAA